LQDREKYVIQDGTREHAKNKKNAVSIAQQTRFNKQRKLGKISVIVPVGTHDNL
jgi:hypothetical protein